MLSFQLDTNIEYLYTRPGVLKLVTCVLGAISLGLGWHGYEESRFNNDPEVGDLTEDEVFFVIASGAALFVSVCYLTAHVLSYGIASGRRNQVTDTTFHYIAGKAVFAAGLLLIASADDIQSHEKCKDNVGTYIQCQLMDYKIIGGTFGIINAIVYDFAAYWIYSTKELP